jgi:hypothetical protein
MYVCLTIVETLIKMPIAFITFKNIFSAVKQGLQSYCDQMKDRNYQCGTVPKSNRKIVERENLS